MKPTGKIGLVWVFGIGIFNFIFLKSKSNTVYFIETRNVGAWHAESWTYIKKALLTIAGTKFSESSQESCFLGFFSTDICK